MIYCRKDEHSLIAVYCQKLMDGQLSQLIPDSPMQVALEIDAEQRKELEFMIKELEQENANLKEEYNHLKIVGCQMPGIPLNPPDVTPSEFSGMDLRRFPEYPPNLIGKV